MKKLQVELEDDLMMKAKMYAMQNGITLKELVTSLLEGHFEDAQTVLAPTPFRPIKKEKPKAKHNLVPEPEISRRSARSIVDETKGIHEAMTASTYKPRTFEEIMSEERDPMDEQYFYILRKTFASDLPEDEDTWVTNGTMRWLVPKDCCKHYDKDGYLIPFRYTDPFLQRIEPTQEQIKELEQSYEKPVTIEV